MHITTTFPKSFWVSRDLLKQSLRVGLGKWTLRSSPCILRQNPTDLVHTPFTEEKTRLKEYELEPPSQDALSTKPLRTSQGAVVTWQPMEQTQLPTHWSVLLKGLLAQVFQTKGLALKNAPMSNINNVTRVSKASVSLVCHVISVIAYFTSKNVSDGLLSGYHYSGIPHTNPGYPLDLQPLLGISALLSCW